jgi:hypothetical protein
MHHFFLILLIVLYSVTLRAEESTDPTEAPESQAETSRSTSKAPFFKPGSWSVTLYGGKYEVAEEPQFVGIRNDYALGVGASADLNQYPYLGLDFEYFYVNRDYDTPVGPPLFGTIDNDTSVQTNAFLVGGRAFYPAQGPFRIYGSAGIGYFHTRMVVYGSTLGLPGSYEEKDMSMEFYYGAGIGYMFGKWGLGLDYRHFNLEGSFGGFDISNADLGGDLFMVGLRFSF